MAVVKTNEKNERGIAAVVIVGIVIAVVAVAAGVTAAFLVLRGGGEGGGTGGGTSGGETSGSGAGNSVASASSLSFRVTSSYGGISADYTFKAKDIGSSGMKVRVEGTVAGQSFIYIINGAQRKVWMYAGDQWIDMSEHFSEFWDEWASSFEEYRTELSNWTGGTWTSPDGSVTISDIQVNPSLPDSLFQP